MKELYKISPHTSGPGFQMQLRSGTVEIPDERGCYVVSTGCGSGKTESCKSIIRNYANDGVLYCVDTIAELKKMFQWIMDNLVDLGLKESDVEIISSDPEHVERFRQYQSNPKGITIKKVLLITHVRMWTDLINFFVIFNSKSAVTSFDGDFSKLMKSPDLRKYIIFDETPNFIRPFFSCDKALMGTFVKEGPTGEWVAKSRQEITNYYETFLRTSRLDPFPKQDSVVNSIKKDVILNVIPMQIPQWIHSTKDCEITFRPLDICQPVMTTHVIILEGAGDILFGWSSVYKIIDVPTKYSCSISFNSFDFSLRRNTECQPNEAELQAIADDIFKIIHQNQTHGRKTLVVVWKNIGKRNSGTDDTSYYEDMKNRLASMVALKKDSYAVIYFGSSESKSTNEYRDFTDIILVGKWSIPTPDVSKFCKDFGVTLEDSCLTMWAYIQLLARIGIRKQDGQQYTVHHSSDYPPTFIEKLYKYFSNQPISSPAKDKITSIEEKLFEDRLRDSKIRANIVKDITTLAKNKQELFEAIKNDHPCRVSVSLKVLKNILPKGGGRRRDYAPLVTSLNYLRIVLEIL